MAAVAACSASIAQVTVTGTFGAGYQSYESAATAAAAGCTVPDGDDALILPCVLGAAAVPAATNKGATMTDSSIRMAVNEDLGNGIKATGFVQFAGNASRGGNVTKEDSSLALSSGFGTVAISNTRSSHTAIGANVFATSLPYTTFYMSGGVASRAAGDLISFTAPAISGVTVGIAQFEATEGDKTSAAKVNILSANYANGPLSVAFAHKMKNNAAAPAGTKKADNELALTYDLGVAKIGFGYGSKTTNTGKALSSYGVNVPMGAISLGVNGAKRGDAEFMEGGVKYAFSKRTTLNAMYGTYEATAGTARAATATAAATAARDAIDGKQYRMGIVHTF